MPLISWVLSSSKGWSELQCVRAMAENEGMGVEEQKKKARKKRESEDETGVTTPRAINAKIECDIAGTHSLSFCITRSSRLSNYTMWFDRIFFSWPFHRSL